MGDLLPECYTFDVALPKGREVRSSAFRVMELNCINTAGLYHDGVIKPVMLSWHDYLIEKEAKNKEVSSS